MNKNRHGLTVQWVANGQLKLASISRCPAAYAQSLGPVRLGPTGDAPGSGVCQLGLGAGAVPLLPPSQIPRVVSSLGDLPVAWKM